ncbi:MAG: pseudouridine synthase, partial [Anaerovoracaceae bacterium]
RRLDKFLRRYLSGAPLTMIYKIIRKDVKVNGKREQGSYTLSEGDLVTLYLSDDQFSSFRRQKKKTRAKKQFRVVYEDDHILLVNKPCGLLTHGDSTEKKNHLANQVLSYLMQEESWDRSGDSVFSPAPVNRLDRNTSGLVIFCKDYETQREMAEMLKTRDCIRKIYLALAVGVIKDEAELRDSMVRNDKDNRTVVLDGGDEPSGSTGIKTKEMITGVRPLRSGKIEGLSSSQRFTLCEIELSTGRTHQIRAQLAAHGHPLAGDVKYGDKRINGRLKAELGVTSQLLHAYRLEFSGVSGKLSYLDGKSFTADPPASFDGIIKKLK